MVYIERALADGYAQLTGEGKNQKITYVAVNHKERYADPEEQIRAEFWAELIYRYGYDHRRIGVEVIVPDRTPSDRADLVIFRDDARKRPYAVVECKKEGITDAEFSQAIEQAVGNGTWAKFRADYVMVVAGMTRRVLDFTGEYADAILERERNIIADLPMQYGKPQEYKYYKDGTLDIEPVSQEKLISAILKSHQTLWGGGKLSPPVAFGELSKIIFVKINDEKAKRLPGEPYEFQIKTHETSQSLAARIRALYQKQQEREPDVFTDTIRVDDTMLRDVVSHLEGINLSETDLDTKGVAFEQFMDSFFKGNFGQYFTPRTIIEFAVQMLQPTNDDLILDPACGSGGFLLYALDAVRKEADKYYPNHLTDPRQARLHRDHWHGFAITKLFGIEINDEIARVAKMNMIIHDDGHTNVVRGDALEPFDDLRKLNPGLRDMAFDIVLTNPPFGSNVSIASRPYLAKEYDLANKIDKKGKEIPRDNQKTEILFLEKVWYFLKPGTGRAAIVVPDTILLTPDHQYVRDWLLGHFQLQAVVSLPQTAFAYYGAAAKSSIIFLRKRGHNEVLSSAEVVFMAAPTSIGYDATGRKTDNQLPDVAGLYREFEKDATRFLDENMPVHQSMMCFAVPRAQLNGRLDVEYQSPHFRKLRARINVGKFNIVLVRDICESAKTGFAAGGSNQTADRQQGVPHLRPLNITSTGEISLDGTKFVPRSKLKPSQFITRGEVLFNNTNSALWVGKTALFNGDYDAACSNHITRLKINPTLAYSEYVVYLFNKLREWGFFEVISTKFNNQAGINTDTLLDLPIPLPSLEIQHDIISQMAQACEEARKLRAQADATLANAQARFEQALLGE